MAKVLLGDKNESHIKERGEGFFFLLKSRCGHVSIKYYCGYARLVCIAL